MLNEKILSELINRPHFVPQVFDRLQSVKIILGYFESYIARPRDEAKDDVWWQITMEAARSMLPNKTSVHDAIAVLNQRHRLYGGKSLLIGGINGIAVRCIDKLCRIENMMEHNFENPVDDDKLEDNFIDLFNYSILALMLLRGGLK